LDKKTIQNVAEAFGLSPPTAKKYIHMTETEINGLDAPVSYKKRASSMNDWLNVIFKMMLDGQEGETIYYYILSQPEFRGKAGQVEKYIYLIGKNNFPDRPAFHINYLTQWVYPPDVTVISRTSLLKYLLTVNPKVQKDKEIGEHIDIIKEKFPVAAKVEEIFREFHAVLMGKEPDRLDGFLAQYEDSEIKSFCNGIKKDITPVKNAISFEVSSGFVEGNNNKFKLLKRIVYGRSGLVNLEKKCKLAFLSNKEDFDLASLV
jgi:hypothetical protein